MIALRSRLRGGPFTVLSSGVAMLTAKRDLRRPDLIVDGGYVDEAATLASAPRLVVEVVSPITRDFPAYEKVDDYRAVLSVSQVLLIDPNAIDTALWSRGASPVSSSWTMLRDIGSIAEFTALETALPIAEIYADVVLPAKVEDANLTG